MNRAFRIHTVLFAALATFSLRGAVCHAEDEVQAAPNAEVNALVEQLVGDDVTAQREAAERLVELGEAAVAPLAKAAEVEDEQVMTRCFDTLGRLLAADEAKAAQAAQQALNTLSKSDIRKVAVRALTTLRLDVLRQRLVKQAQNAPGPAVPGQPALGRVTTFTRVTTTQNGQTMELERAADGSFTGKIIETVNGEKKETAIKAASEKELEEKFPEAYKAFEKRPQVRPPQLGGFPVVPRAGIQPGGIQPGIQINGQFFGGANGLNHSMKVSVINGKRQVEVQNGDEKIEINDVNGKDIQLKHTRQVDGKAKTDEYKAADLDELKKKHPEAAKLYEKHGGPNLVGGVAGAIQLQVRAGVPGAPLQLQIPGFQPELVPAQPNRPAGPRTIRAEQDGRLLRRQDLRSWTVRGDRYESVVTRRRSAPG